MTVVRLRNLIERAPQMRDLPSVTALMIACERIDAGVTDPSAEEILRIWQQPGFNLHTDAWVIVTRTGQTIGYADVRHSEDGQLGLCLRVHPDYRCRGVGTLLLWLAEERARHMANSSPNITVLLSITVRRLNRIACHFFESEGYQMAHHFWRLLIEEECDGNALDQSGVHSMDLSIDAYNLFGTDLQPRRTGMYVARQYVVYHKVLQAGKERLLDRIAAEHPVAV